MYQMYGFGLIFRNDVFSHSVSKMEGNKKFYMRLPLFIGLSICAGILIGAEMFGGQTNHKNIDQNASKIKDVLSYLDKYYVDTVDTEKLTEEAIRQMLQELDPHTSYIPVEEIKAANEGLEGNFEGIGIEFNIFQDTLYVVTPLTGGPSEEVGLKAGDKIIRVDGKNIAGINLTTQQVFKYLKGKKGTKVVLSVMRRGIKELLEFTIKRDKIPIFTVDVGFMIDKTTGYVKINRFGAKTYDEFKTQLKNLQGQGMRRLVLDLRDNPGGYMGTAIKIADEFLSDDKTIVYTKGKERRFNEEAKATKAGDFEEGTLIVLVNEGSASASEIVSGALQDHDRALIVGRRTFGKGLVQKPIELDDGSELRLTISRYYIPSGRSIQRPYEKGKSDKYSADYYERTQSGELFHVDSIKFDKSQKYQTASGREVYGGGGVMPDYFVAQDTSFFSNYLQKLYGLNLVREFVLNYTNTHEETLKAQSLEEFCANFEVNQTMLDELIRMGESLGVRYQETEFGQSEKFLKNQIKSLIAKSFWHNEGLYKVLLSEDVILQKSLQLFDEAEGLHPKK